MVMHLDRYEACDHQYHPSGGKIQEMFLLRMDRDEFTYQSARPVVESHVAAYSDALEPYFAAVSQRPVYMVIAGDQRGILSALLRIYYFLRIFDVFISFSITIFSS